MQREEEMIEDKATEKLKKRAQKLGLIVNAGVDEPKPTTKGNGTDGKVTAKPDKKVKK
jgi:hypothetical protein